MIGKSKKNETRILLLTYLFSVILCMYTTCKFVNHYSQKRRQFTDICTYW